MEVGKRERDDDNDVKLERFLLLQLYQEAHDIVSFSLSSCEQVITKSKKEIELHDFFRKCFRAVTEKLPVLLHSCLKRQTLNNYAELMHYNFFFRLRLSSLSLKK